MSLLHFSRFGLRAAALGAVLALSGCTSDAPVVSEAASPAMWQVQDGDTRIILIGTVHQLPAQVRWQRGKVSTAIADADELWLELAPTDLPAIPATFARISVDEPVAPLDQRIGAERARIARDYAADAGIDRDDAERMESWALSFAVGTVIAADAGLSTEDGVESQLTSAFTQARKPVRGLEAASAQLALFDDLPDALQNQMLSKTVADAPTARAHIHALVRQWAHGDVEGIARQAAQDLAETPGLIEPLVTRRNRAWVAQLIGRMERPGTILVAVGTGHLVGDGSVITQLRQNGLAVERIQ
jgi:hypothetical protein